MINADLIKQEKEKALQRLSEAIKGDNEEEFAEAFNQFAKSIQESIINEANGVIDNARMSIDSQVLTSRGVRQLTSEETNFYQKTIEAMKSPVPKQALADLDVVLPKTVIDTVFDDLMQNHPLLDAINFQNTSGLTELILNVGEAQLAKWGPLCGKIDKELEGGFKKVDLMAMKLSAFLPVCKGMLDLGPNWLDRYVRTILSEAIALGLEEGIINGTGKDMPVGMNRNVAEDVSISAGVYPEKKAVKVTALDPVSYGELLSKLTVNPISKKSRIVDNVIMIVNPEDYLLKIMPVTTVRGADGLYRSNVLPFPTKIIESLQVPKGKMIVGLAHKYFMGIGTEKSGKIEYSDEYRFLEDERVYLAKLYGNGRALDDNAFVYCDISGLKPTNLKVEVVGGTTPETK